ncbi:MAG: DMT family transporter [Acidimicrobiales bacterium]
MPGRTTRHREAIAGRARRVGLLRVLHRFAETSTAAGLWPLVIARAVSVPIVTMLAWRLTGHVLPEVRTARRLSILTGISEMAANALLVVALRRGPLAVASVFGSLFPVSTVVLAALLLRERVTRRQMLGVGLAVMALALVAS